MLWCRWVRSSPRSIFFCSSDKSSPYSRAAPDWNFSICNQACYLGFPPPRRILTLITKACVPNSDDKLKDFRKVFSTLYRWFWGSILISNKSWHFRDDNDSSNISEECIFHPVHALIDLCTLKREYISGVDRRELFPTICAFPGMDGDRGEA